MLLELPKKTNSLFVYLFFLNLKPIKIFNQNPTTMKKLTYSLLLVVASVLSSFGQAKVQFIHNDTASLLASIDLYVVSGTSVTLVDDFNFQTASTFLDVQGGNNLRLGIALPNSTSVADTLVSIQTTFNLTNASNYYMIFNNGNVLLLGPVPITSGTTGQINVAFYHGAHGVPGVDVQVRESIALNTVLFNNTAPFTANNSILTIPTAAYDLRVADTSGVARLASLEADVSTAGALPGGTSAMVFASGVLGATGTYAFKVLAALPINVANPSSQKATVVTLPLLNSALVQVIHASPDADSVQVFVDNDIMGFTGATPNAVPNSRFFATASPSALPFQGASPYFEVDWKTDATADILVTDKTGNTEVLTKTFTLVNGSENVIVAGGAVANLDLYAGAGRRFSNGGPQSGFLGTTVFHGSPDAPNVDASIVSPASASGSLGTDIAFGTFSNYAEVPYVSSLYTAQVAATGGGATFRSTPLPLGLNPQANGLAFTLYVTGYVNPAANNNGPSLQLCAASLNGNPVVGVGNLCFDLVVFTSVEEQVVNKMIMYPNPANNNFNVEYTLESAQTVKYNVYNTMGQLIISGDEGVQNAGRNAVNVNVANLSTGQYVMQMLIGNEINVTRTFIKE